jgi:hypothetical protein
MDTCKSINVSPDDALRAIMAYCNDAPDRLVDILPYLKITEEQVISAHNSGLSFQQVCDANGVSKSDLRKLINTINEERGTKINLKEGWQREPIFAHPWRCRKEATTNEDSIATPEEANTKHRKKRTPKITDEQLINAFEQGKTLEQVQSEYSVSDATIYARSIAINKKRDPAMPRVSFKHSKTGALGAPLTKWGRAPAATNKVAATDVKTQIPIRGATATSQQQRIFAPSAAPAQVEPKVYSASDTECLRKQAVEEAVALTRRSLFVFKEGTVVNQSTRLNTLLKALGKDDLALKMFIDGLHEACINKELDVFIAAAALGQLKIATSGKKSEPYPSKQWEFCAVGLSEMLLKELYTLNNINRWALRINEVRMVQKCISYYLQKPEDLQLLERIVETTALKSKEIQDATADRAATSNTSSPTGKPLETSQITPILSKVSDVAISIIKNDIRVFKNGTIEYNSNKVLSLINDYILRSETAKLACMLLPRSSEKSTP